MFSIIFHDINYAWIYANVDPIIIFHFISNFFLKLYIIFSYRKLKITKLQNYKIISEILQTNILYFLVFALKHFS